MLVCCLGARQVVSCNQCGVLAQACYSYFVNYLLFGGAGEQTQAGGDKHGEVGQQQAGGDKAGKTDEQQQKEEQQTRADKERQAEQEEAH